MKMKLTNQNALVLVDDDPTERMLAEKFHAKSEVDNPLLTFASGEALLEYLDPSTAPPMPALVLVDVNMPLMDGFQVVEKIRAYDCYREVPVVALFSNSDEPSDVAKAPTVGADHYVVKPAGKQEYVSFLNSLIRRPE